MDRPSSSLFEVFLRLRPPIGPAETERFLDVETEDDEFPRHITIKPPANDHRKRAVERFAFTRVFEEDAEQLDVLNGAGVIPLVEGVLGADGRDGRDGLLATLGVTGSGKSHTILGTKTQRGLTQLALDILFQSLGDRLVDPTHLTQIFASLSGSDSSEAQMFPASVFLNSIYGEGASVRGSVSRAQTPMLVNTSSHTLSTRTSEYVESLSGMSPCLNPHSHSMLAPSGLAPKCNVSAYTPRVFQRLTRSAAKQEAIPQDASILSLPSAKHKMPRPSALPHVPSVDGIKLEVDQSAEYAVVLSMFEVYNDRIFDLLADSSSTSGSKMIAPRRRALLFKHTEMSPDRKIVAGLRKIVCCSLEEALTVLETGLIERRVAGTGSNAVSSRSHAFFCFEVKKRNRSYKTQWSTSTLSIVDLAGVERARQAKTAGATLAEGGKINESYMYLGQFMQMHSDNQEGSKQNVIPFRQCKLTELLFSNSFPSHHHAHAVHRAPQKAVMLVTANPTGDFNITSQILRYSALAREVTVPRIPSVTSQVFGPHVHPTGSGRASPSALHEDLELALKEITRLAEERDVLSLRLEEERSRRAAAEASWSASESRMQALEMEVREECYADFEARLEQERRRWKGAWDEEADRNDEHLDRKLEILAKVDDAFEIHEDVQMNNVGDEEAQVRQMETEMENEALREKVRRLEQELLQRSPTKTLKTPKTQRVLKARKWQGEENGIFQSP